MGAQVSWVNLSIWVAFGLVAGFIAHLLSYDTIKGGLASSLTLGILGAVAGGSLATFVYGVGMRGVDLTSLAIAITSSLAFLVIYQLTFHNKTKVIQ